MDFSLDVCELFIIELGIGITYKDYVAQVVYQSASPMEEMIECKNDKVRG